MSEFAPPDEPGDSPGARPETLTPQAIAAVLADFRRWLEQAAAPADEPAGARDQSSPTSQEPLDLHTLLGQFVALRHEVNLQTKASRAQQEQNAEALRDLEKAIQTLEEAQAAPPTDENLRPLLKTLVDLHDNLSLALREVERSEEVLKPLLGQLAANGPSGEGTVATPEGENPAGLARPSWWARWFGARPANEAALRALQDWRARSAGVRRAQEAALLALQDETISLRRRVLALEAGRLKAREAAERVLRFVTSLITGYTMSLHRVERALRQCDLEAIPTVGLPYDPETMEVLEVVYEVGRTSSEVIEEVRRGYFWGGHVFRFAQVRVARSPSN